MSDYDDDEKITRSDAIPVVINSGVSKNPLYLAVKAQYKQGPPYTYGKNGVEYEKKVFDQWLADEVARKQAKLKARQGE